MKIFTTIWFVSKAKAILWLMVVTLAILLYFYWGGKEEDKLTTLLGGVSVGFLLAIIQFMFSWDEYKERDKLRLLGLKKVLEDKNDRVYYGTLISKAKKKIDLMGKTGHHFMEDFANDGGQYKEAKVFLEALGRGVIVRFLLPEAARNENNQATISYIEELTNQYDDFECRYFKHPECHSIFVADNDVIIGPFFPGARSLNTPALHVGNDAELPKCYLKYFDEVWEACEAQE